MKNKLNLVVLFSIIAIVLFENKSMGQVIEVDSVKIATLWEIEKSTIVTKETKPKVFPIRIEDDLPLLTFLIGAQTKSGVIKFTIYDPTGKEMDNLPLKWSEKGKYHIIDGDNVTNKAKFLAGQSIESSDSGITVKGAFSATYKNPIPGEWTIKVSPDMADGYYKVILETIKPSPKVK